MTPLDALQLIAAALGTGVLLGVAIVLVSYLR